MSSPVQRGIAAGAIFSILLVITGCASTGGIKPQDHAAPASEINVGSAIKAADTNAHWPAEDWWESYNDLQLNAWIENAKANSPSLAIAQARVREAQSMAADSRSELLPRLDGSLSIQRQHWSDNEFYGPGALSNANTWNNTGSLGLSYHLDVWGKYKNSAEGALDIAHATSADERAAQLELETNIVRTYVEMSMNFALLDIARSTLEQQRRIADLATRRLAGGIGTQLEVTQAHTPIPEYEREVDAFEEAIALEKNELAALAGKGPGAGDSVSRPTLSLNRPTGLPSALPAELIGHRPDVVAARWMVASQARGIDVAKANFYPDINLLASIGGYAAAGPLFQMFKSMSGSWSAGPAVSLPIFDGGRLRAQLGTASAGYDLAVDQYNETIIKALKEISDQVVRIRSLTTQREDAERSVEIARTSYDLSHQAFQRGLTDYLNVLTAQTQLLRAQNGLAKVQAEQLNAFASLEAALGGGLMQPRDQPEPESTLPGHGHDSKLSSLVSLTKASSANQ